MKRPCLDCGELTGGSRCTPCRRARDRAREATRPSPGERGYGHAWRVLRERIIERDGHQCTRCRTAGTPANPLSVHHVIAREAGGSDDEQNLIALCKVCHGRVGPQVKPGVGGGT